MIVFTRSQVKNKRLKSEQYHDVNESWKEMKFEMNIYRGYEIVLKSWCDILAFVEHFVSKYSWKITEDFSKQYFCI